jgi:hypothetical protein
LPTGSGSTDRNLVIHRLTNEVDKWNTKVTDIKTLRTRRSSEKKEIDDISSAKMAGNSTVKWIAPDESSEAVPANLEDTINPKGRHNKYAEWFTTKQDKYRTWFRAIENHERDRKETRVISIKGSYGTGKTATVYVI